MALNSATGKAASKSKTAAQNRRRSAGVAAGTDAELIRLCREFDVLEKRILIATLSIDNGAGRDKITTPLYRQQDILLESIRGTTPRTLAGCKAIAASLDLWTSFLGQTGIDRDFLELLLAGLAKLKD